MEQTFIPGPNLRIADNTAPMGGLGEPKPAPTPVPDEPAPKEIPLQDRLRKYSPTSGYARYTAMAADRIDELTQANISLTSTGSRLRAILAERNYKILALTTENEHHKVNEEHLQELITRQRHTIMEWEDDYDALRHRVRSAEGQLQAARDRGFWATIIHYVRSK